MTYKEYSTVLSKQEFKDLVDIVLAKAAAAIKGEPPNANAVINDKRWKLADIILAGVFNNAWYRAIVVKIAQPDTLLAPFLTSPVGDIPAQFDNALDNAVRNSWNDLAGVNSND